MYSRPSSTNWWTRHLRVEDSRPMQSHLPTVFWHPEKSNPWHRNKGKARKSKAKQTKETMTTTHRNTRHRGIYVWHGASKTDPSVSFQSCKVNSWTRECSACRVHFNPLRCQWLLEVRHVQIVRLVFKTKLETKRFPQKCQKLKNSV